MGRSTDDRRRRPRPVTEPSLRVAIGEVYERHPYYGKRWVQVELRGRGPLPSPADAGTGSGTGPSVAIGRRSAGAGTGPEVRWSDQERLRAAGGQPPIAGAAVRRVHPHLKMVVLQGMRWRRPGPTDYTHLSLDFIYRVAASL